MAENARLSKRNHAVKHRAAKIGSSKLGPVEVSVPKVRAAQDRAAQVGILKVGAHQLRIDKAHTRKVQAAEIEPRQVGLLPQQHEHLLPTWLNERRLPRLNCHLAHCLQLCLQACDCAFGHLESFCEMLRSGQPFLTGGQPRLDGAFQLGDLRKRAAHVFIQHLRPSGLQDRITHHGFSGARPILNLRAGSACPNTHL